MRNKFSILKFSIFYFLFSIIFSLDAHATPPTQIELKYDKDLKILYADIAHYSDKADKHYISKIFIQINQELPQKYYFRRQVKPNKFEVEFPLELKPKDVVNLKAQCSQGGSLEVSLEIAENEEESQAAAPVKPAVQTPKPIQKNSY